MTSYNDGPSGMRLCGTLAPADQELLQAACAESLSRLAAEWQESVARKQTFWINLWQRSGGGAKMPLARVDELDAFARQLADRMYGPGVVELDGYGWTVNPSGSVAQSWHIDYARDYSNLFISLSPLTEQNCVQYAVLPPDVPADLLARATRDLAHVDMDLLRRECDWLSIRQLIVPPFSIVKLDFGTIHRAVANAGGFDRVVFWIAVTQGKDLLPEERLVVIEDPR